MVRGCHCAPRAAIRARSSRTIESGRPRRPVTNQWRAKLRRKVVRCHWTPRAAIRGQDARTSARLTRNGVKTPEIGHTAEETDDGGGLKPPPLSIPTPVTPLSLPYTLSLGGGDAGCQDTRQPSGRKMNRKAWLTLPRPNGGCVIIAKIILGYEARCEWGRGGGGDKAKAPITY